MFHGHISCFILCYPIFCDVLLSVICSFKEDRAGHLNNVNIIFLFYVFVFVYLLMLLLNVTCRPNIYVSGSTSELRVRLAP